MQKEDEKKAAKDAERSSLHQVLEKAIQKRDEADLIRQKLEETKALHESTIKELNRIHDDKLHSLEQELNAVRQEKQSRSGANAQVQERYRQDLEQIKKTHAQEVAQLLKEHKEEVGALNAQFEEQKTKAVGEFEVCYQVPVWLPGRAFTMTIRVHRHYEGSLVGYKKNLRMMGFGKLEDSFIACTPSCEIYIQCSNCEYLQATHTCSLFHGI